MNLKQAYRRLKEIKDEVPELTLDNNGYEYLSQGIKEKYAEQIKEISAIMKEQFPRFVRFDNFKPRKNGAFAIRCQTHWSESFTGVEYFDTGYFIDEEIGDEVNNKTKKDGE